MRQVTLALVAALTIAAALAGAGFGSIGSQRARSSDLGGFGGPVGHRIHVVPIWHESSTPAVPPLRRVTCATAVLGDTSTCYQVSTSR